MILFNKFTGKIFSESGIKMAAGCYGNVTKNFIVPSVSRHNNREKNRNMLDKLGRLVTEWKTVHMTDNIRILILLQSFLLEVNKLQSTTSFLYSNTFNYWRSVLG